MTLGRGNLLGVLCRTYGTGRHNSTKKAILKNQLGDERIFKLKRFPFHPAR